MSDDIQKETTGSRSRYVLRKNGHEAELTISVLSPQTVIADHTDVAEALRGTGAGAALAAFLVDDARENGFKIIPLCPFVNSERRKHPEWADVFQV